MVNTNIFIEVEDSINETIIKPHKKNRTFTKLINALLNGYANNEYIRCYVDGELDDFRKESETLLDDAISSMNESIFNMGIYTDELKKTTESGKEKFEKYSEEKRKDVEELKDTVDELKEQNAQIMSMLEKLVSGGISIEKKESSKTDIAKESNNTLVVNKKDESNIKDKKSPVIELSVDNTPDEEDSQDDTSGIDVSNLLSNLMMGNEYTF